MKTNHRDISWPLAIAAPALAFAPMYVIPLAGWFAERWVFIAVLALSLLWVGLAVWSDMKQDRVRRIREAETERTVAYIRSLPVEVVATELGRTVQR